ncbi:MAG: DEAD/DEAH box helicase [Myxococcota bacterium]|nr:DEAD/DEAH box helicase [Myxococcota bacterium]
MEYRGLELDPFQVTAIEHIRNDRSVLVSAPTGTGKTIIADFIVDRALQEGREVIYTAPVKALSNQKYRDYTRLYGESAVGLITGDLVINRGAILRIMTTEILRNMLLSGEELPNLAYVIIDEIHFLDDVERGTVWEEVLIYLPTRVRILGLSATLANIREFANWLSHVRQEKVEIVIEETRHVPLHIKLANRDAGICDLAEFEAEYQQWSVAARKAMAEMARSDTRSGKGRGRRGQRHRRSRKPQRLMLPGQKETRHYEVVKNLADDYLPLLYFAFSRKVTETWARELARRCPPEGFTSEEEERQIKQAVDVFDAEYPKVMTGEQEAMYLKGIAFHHAGAHVGLKAFVEELYERKLIKVLYCTSTFALGINMPARSVAFAALRKYDGRSVVPLTVRQFMQKAGRAGRRGMDQEGHVFIIQEFGDFERDRESIRNYIAGGHEDVTSSFNLSFNSVVNLLERHQGNLDEIRRVTERSFLNFHYLQRARLNQRRADDMARSLRDDGWDPESEDQQIPRQLRQRLKKWKKLSRSLDKDQGRVFASFMDKVQILQSIGYLEDNLDFNAGARVLSHRQIEEIFSSELVLSGLLESLEPAELFGVFCSMSNSFGRTVVVRERPRGKLAKVSKQLKQIRFSEVVRTCEQTSGVPVTFTPELLLFGVGWYEGRSLQELCLMIESPTDVSGDLVSGFRRAKDLAGQMRRVFQDDDWMADKLKDVAKTVSRDEVEVVD